MEKNTGRYVLCMFIWTTCFAFYVSPVDAQPVRDAVVMTAQSQIGIAERTGRNDGKVNKYQEPYGAKNLPWCNYFVKWTYDRNGVDTEGMDGRAISSYVKKKRVSYNRARKGDIIYIPTRVGTGHTGIIHTKHKDRVRTIEGNYRNKVSWVIRKANKTYYAQWIQDGTYVYVNTTLPSKTEHPILEPTPVDKLIDNIKNYIKEKSGSLKEINVKKAIKYVILVIILLIIQKKKGDDEDSSN